MMDLTMAPTSQPMAAAASAAVRVVWSNSTTLPERSSCLIVSWNAMAVGLVCGRMFVGLSFRGGQGPELASSETPWGGDERRNPSGQKEGALVWPKGLLAQFTLSEANVLGVTRK